MVLSSLSRVRVEMTRGVVTAAADEFWLPTNEGWLCVDRRGVVLRRLSSAEDVVDIIAAAASSSMPSVPSSSMPSVPSAPISSSMSSSSNDSTHVIVTHPDGNMCVGFRK